MPPPIISSKGLGFLMNKNRKLEIRPTISQTKKKYCGFELSVTIEIELPMTPEN